MLPCESTWTPAKLKTFPAGMMTLLLRPSKFLDESDSSCLLIVPVTVPGLPSVPLDIACVLGAVRCVGTSYPCLQPQHPQVHRQRGVIGDQGLERLLCAVGVVFCRPVGAKVVGSSLGPASSPSLMDPTHTPPFRDAPPREIPSADSPVKQPRDFRTQGIAELLDENEIMSP
jgi:hypothetical protein